MHCQCGHHEVCTAVIVSSVLKHADAQQFHCPVRMVNGHDVEDTRISKNSSILPQKYQARTLKTFYNGLEIACADEYFAA